MGIGLLFVTGSSVCSLLNFGIVLLFHPIAEKVDWVLNINSKNGAKQYYLIDWVKTGASPMVRRWIILWVESESRLRPDITQKSNLHPFVTKNSIKRKSGGLQMGADNSHLYCAQSRIIRQCVMCIIIIAVSSKFSAHTIWIHRDLQFRNLVQRLKCLTCKLMNFVFYLN